MKSLSSYIDIFFTVVTHGIAELEELNRTLEDFLEGELKRFESWAEEQTCKLEEDQKANFYDFFSDDYHKFSDKFPSTVRSSLVVTCYSFLESNLLRLCSQMQRDKGLTIGAEDLSGKGIFQAQKYIKKVLQFDFPDQTEEWQEITKINQLRNALVHEQGRVKPGNDKLRSYIDNNTGLLALDNHNRVKINKGHVEKFLNTIHKFFLEIKNTLPN